MERIGPGEDEDPLPVPGGALVVVRDYEPVQQVAALIALQLPGSGDVVVEAPASNAGQPQADPRTAGRLIRLPDGSDVLPGLVVIVNRGGVWVRASVLAFQPELALPIKVWLLDSLGLPESACWVAESDIRPVSDLNNQMRNRSHALSTTDQSGSPAHLSESRLPSPPWWLYTYNAADSGDNQHHAQHQAGRNGRSNGSDDQSQ